MPLVDYAVWSRAGKHRAPRVRSPVLAAKTWAMAAHRSQVSDYIEDATDGFRLSPQLLRAFITQPERYAAGTVLARQYPGRGT